MNWRFCPHCETQLDEATGICPACRWDPLAEPPPAAPEPAQSLMERYRGTEYDSNRVATMSTSRRGSGPAPKAKLALVVGVLVLFGIYGGMLAYTQLRDAEPPAPATVSVP